MYGSKVTGPVLALVGAALLLAQPVAADALAEQHVLNLYFENPATGTLQGSFEMPLFDTQGGTRALIGLRVDYFLNSTYTEITHENPTADWHGCEVDYTHTWVATRNGARWFPFASSSNVNLNITTGTGTVLGPFHAAVPVYTSLPTGLSGFSATSDAALLATLVGSGAFTVDYVHTLSAITAVRPPDRAWGAAPLSQRVFDPHMIDLHVDRIGMDLSVTYYYNEVPEPSALALLAVGVFAGLRRR
jgi:hypothetical protein